MKPNLLKEIYIQDGNYGYLDDNLQWISIAKDQFILNNYYELKIDGQDGFSVQDPLSIQNDD